MIAVVAAIVATALTILVGSNLALGNNPIRSPLPSRYVVGDAQFLRDFGSILAPPLLEGNRVRALINGDQIFSAMLGSIRRAKSTLTMETYIYWSGSIGGEFTDEFVKAAQRGVRVKILLDWVGGRLDDAQLKRMRDAGVEIRRYNPPSWWTLGTFNNRTHRKIMVADGRIGFIGGVGLADQWRGNAQDPQHWRDTHFEVEGPAVGQLQSAFIDNWLQTTGEVLDGEVFLPPLRAHGTSQAQVFTSSPQGGAQSMQLLYLLSIASAAHSIRLSASYFVPDEVAIQAFVEATQRGVDVKILVPGASIDKAIVRHASRATWGTLLEAGVQIFEYQPTMFHCKVLIVDGAWASVGSTNFDARSFHINDEANLNVFDESFGQAQLDIFTEDLESAERVTLESWRERSWKERTLDWAASMIASQL